MQRVSGHREWRWSSRFVRFVSDHLQDRTASRILLQQCSGHENASFSKMWLDYIAKLSVLERISVVCVCVCVCWLYLEGVQRRSSFHIFRGHHNAWLRAALPASHRLNGPERLWHFAGKIEHLFWRLHSGSYRFQSWLAYRLCWLIFLAPSNPSTGWYNSTTKCYLPNCSQSFSHKLIFL